MGVRLNGRSIFVIITSDVRTTKTESTDLLEPEAAMKHIRETVMKGSRISKCYGDGALDTNDLPTLIHSIGAMPAIIIGRNFSRERYRRLPGTTGKP